MQLYIPCDYHPTLSISETQIAIKQIKNIFEKELSKALNITRVSAPLFVPVESGLNDNLSGHERPIGFDAKALPGRQFEIVQSLAKWKRTKLKDYGFKPGEGLYTDMNALRRDEDNLDNTHSMYVDQWDWEKVITPEERTTETLVETVQKIFGAFKTLEAYLLEQYPALKQYLPDEVKFITTQELEDQYPNLTSKEREDAISRQYKAVFLTQIGKINNSGKKHDDRSPDYDDWTMNGDLLFYYPVFDKAIEMSSMGIRVDADSLRYQLKEAGCEDRLSLVYHKDIINNQLPSSIGGGLGQSRMCLYLLNKVHIGEVQSSEWPAEMLAKYKAVGVPFL